MLRYLDYFIYGHKVGDVWIERGREGPPSMFFCLFFVFDNIPLGPISAKTVFFNYMQRASVH